ncbi:MAG: prepilin-type N-terminal cleavage/methylation domain-containing protein [Desulfatiglandales bacterium]
MMRISTTGKWSSLFPSGNTTKGFTLIELAIVVVLIGLFLALSIPRFRHTLVTDDLKTTIRRIIGLMKGLRDEAIREQKVYIVHLDLESNRIWVETDGMGEEEMAMARERAFKFPQGIRILDVWHRGRGKKVDGVAVIRFTKKGYVEQTVIHLGAEDGREFSLALSPFLGKIKVYNRYVDIYK